MTRQVARGDKGMTALLGNITPEEWRIDADDPTIVVDVQDCVIARFTVPTTDPPEWAVNNAKLAARAPLLAEALMHCMRELDSLRLELAEVIAEHAEYDDDNHEGISVALAAAAPEVTS
jgi:hypothetical protein